VSYSPIVKATGQVLRGLADDVVRIQRSGDAPVAIWLCPELFAAVLDECQHPGWESFEVPIYSPVTNAIVLVPVRRMGAQ
jgi:hypothetical protein